MQPLDVTFISAVSTVQVNELLRGIDGYALPGLQHPQ